MNEKNYGLDLDKEIADRKDEDWVFGVGERLSGLAEGIKFRDYLPQGEVQKGRDDMMDCATRGPINILETKLNYLYQSDLMLLSNKQWLEKNDYIVGGRVRLADAFNAILSNTSRRGNSMIAPIDSIHSDGCIPKVRMPLEPNMTWSVYHNPNRITSELRLLGKEFKKRFPVNYQRVYWRNYPTIRKYDMIDVAGYAWTPPNAEGVYPRVDYTPNHVFVDFEEPQYTIFDNYIDVVDGDFIKRLAKDYKIYPYGYRILLNEVEVEPPKPVKKDYMKTIKFKTDPRIFIVSNTNPKRLYWIGDNDGSAWDDYTLLLKEGMIEDFEEVDDASFASYDLQGGIVKIDYPDQKKNNSEAVNYGFRQWIILLFNRFFKQKGRY